MDQSGFNGLSKTDLVRDEKPTVRRIKNLEERLVLIGFEEDSLRLKRENRAAVVAFNPLNS